MRIVNIAKYPNMVVGCIRCGEYYNMIDRVLIRIYHDGTVSINDRSLLRVRGFLENKGLDSSDVGISRYFLPLFKRDYTRVFLGRRTGRATLFRLDSDPPRQWRVVREKFCVEVKRRIMEEHGNVQCFANEDIELASNL